MLVGDVAKLWREAQEAALRVFPGVILAMLTRSVYCRLHLAQVKPGFGGCDPVIEGTRAFDPYADSDDLRDFVRCSACPRGVLPLEPHDFACQRHTSVDLVESDIGLEMPAKAP